MGVSETVAQLPTPAVQPRLLNLDEVFTADDYPALAMLKEEQGRAIAGLGVDEEGRVVHCSIVTSSGSASLDAQTCRLLRARAKFEPARDGEGRAIKAAVVQPVRWALEGEQIINPTTAWTERIITRFSPAGAPIECEIEVVGIEVDPEDPLECEVEELNPEQSLPAVGGLPPVIGLAIEETRFLPGERIDPDGAPTAPGDKLVMRRFVKLTIGTDGRVIDCREMDWDGLVEPPPGACDMVPGLFEPFRKPSGEPVAGTGTMIFSIYVRAEAVT